MNYRFLLSGLLAALFCGLAGADTLTLNDGTEFEGEILRETDETIVMNVEIREGLREEKTFKKEEVRKFHKTTVDEATFADKIKPLVPTGDRLTANDYATQIDGVVKPFLNAFPASKFRAETEKILKELEEEKAKVDAGGIKMNGTWLGKEERDANAYEIDARIMAHEMNDLAAAGKLTQALRQFDEIQTGYAPTEVFLEVIPEVQKVLVAYEARINADLAQVEDRIAQRTKAFATLNAVQREAAEEDVARRAAAYERRIDFEKKKRFRWLTLDPYHERPMEETLRQIKSLRDQLEKFDPERIKPMGEAYREAWAAATRGRRSQVEEAVRELKRARIPAAYVDSLTARLEQAVAEGVTSEEEVAPPEEEMPDEDAGEKPGDEEPAEDTPAPKEEAGKDAADDNSDTRADTGDEKDSGSTTKLILLIIIGIVVAVGIGAVFAGRKK